ncbi:MAG: hypothetical protein ABIQ16_17975 [Polyangiaceae bacterium]
MNLRNKLAAAGALSLGAIAPAFAVDPTDALTAIGTLTTGQAGYGPVMFGLAIAAVAIMVGVKWVKRAKGAA